MLLKTKEFKEFLIYLGIITDETNSHFTDILELIQSSVSSNSNRKLNTEELLSSTLECYFKEITNDQRKSISLNIVKKFKENKMASCHSKLIKFVILYSKLQIIPLYTHYAQWKNVKENPMSFQQSTQNQEEVFDNQSKSVIERTRNFNDSTQSKHNLSKSMLNFMERQEKFKKSRLQSKAKVMTNSEIEYTMLCTFSPHINPKSNSPMNNYITKVKEKNPCLRLYEESKLRLSKKELEKEKEMINTNKRSRNNGTTNSSARTPIKHNKTRQYVKQYEDYKQQRAHKKRLQERFENESECTFKPTSFHNSVSKNTPRPCSLPSKSSSQSLIESIMAKTAKTKGSLSLPNDEHKC